MSLMELGNGAGGSEAAAGRAARVGVADPELVERARRRREVVRIVVEV